VMFFISALAETARAPFDLTEAESELVAGYQTDYSSMGYALFWLGEYSNMLLMCGLNTILFWGGYLPPIDWAPLYDVPGIIWLFAKMLVFFFLFAWVKSTVPRYRYDQLMRLGWKVFLPISLLWVVLVSGYLMLTRYGQGTASSASRITALYSVDCAATGWKLDKFEALGREQYWMLTKPNGVSMKARTIRIGTGLPKNEYVQWTDPDGSLFNANISVNDVIGPRGPYSVEILAGSAHSSVLIGHPEVCRPVEPRKIGNPA
jgi:hypothetical protein